MNNPLNIKTKVPLMGINPPVSEGYLLKQNRDKSKTASKVFLIMLGFVFLIFNASKLFAQDFYDADTINTIEITFAENNWDQLLDNLYAAGNEERLTGNALINGVQFTDVGVRYKGNSTYSANQVKNPLNIKLDYINDEQTLDGYGTLKLANVYKDPSFVRETLAYEMARKYMPASQANYINVYINGTHLGLYTNVQSVDKFFLGNHFNSNQNAFFKGELIQNGPPSQSEVWAYYGTDSANYSNYYELKSDDGWDQLIAMLDYLNNFVSNIETYLNVDRHLWMLAYDILLVNLDSPVNYGHNYYLYQDDAGQFNPVVWDLNESFGGFSTLLSGGPPLNVTTMQQLDPFLNESNADYPIISQILSNQRYRKMYVAHMKTIIEENFSNDWYFTRALELQNTIDSDVQNDTNKFYSYNNFLDNVDSSVGGGGGPGNQAVVGLTELMDARINYINNFTEFQATNPTITNTLVNPAIPTANSQIWITTTVSDANFVQLKYRDSVSAAFTGLEMYDDGNHNDGAANDQVYGVAVAVGSTDLQYYIYAENDDAAQFDPQRAAYEFYEISIVGDLAINEFMASNDVTVADQDGEYDDWIELYNNTDTTISLNGYYLSDDGQALDQWIFPDVSIEPYSYLTIWADDDDQVGLHANFKLSASGETIYLSSPSLELIDEVTYGEQTTDVTTGRYPDGTGDFTLMQPTFAASNISDVIYQNGFE